MPCVARRAGGEHLVAGRAATSCRRRRSRLRASRGSRRASTQPRIRGDVDDAVAHHAAVEQQVGGRHQPVADVEGEQALARAGALDLALELRVPPDVVDVDGHAERRALAASSSHRSLRLRQRVHAGAVGGVHRVQRLDRERHAAGARVLEQLADAVAHLLARAGEVLRAMRPARPSAGRRPPAPGTAPRRPRLVDRAPVVVERRAPALAVGGREHAAAAIAGDGEAGVADAPRRVLEPAGATLSRQGEMPRMPWRDAARR